VARFALFLLQQGYSGQKAQASIAVLTPYLGQLAVLRQELSALRHDELIELSEYDEADLLRLDLLNPGKSQGQSAAAGNVSRTTVHERLRLSTVDNFQGEEADIVLISTVRNNPKGNIGFLNDDHRVNVMLSRARLGMYVFGDIQTLEKRKTGM
jgi:superfamily I DNA and/or RNA helicase